MEDIELVLRMQKNDLDALEELMQRNQKDLLKLAYLISGNYADSEDIVQETFVQVYLKKETIREPEYFRTWLLRMMTRIAWRYLKKKSREHPAGDTMETWNPEAKDLADSVFRVVERKEEAEELYQAILRLPVKQRTMVILYYFEEMSTKEIAKLSGCLEGTVKSRLYGARKRLKEELYRPGFRREGTAVRRRQWDFRESKELWDQEIDNRIETPWIVRQNLSTMEKTAILTGKKP